MPNRYTVPQANIVDTDNRNMAAAGLNMSGEINALWSAIDTGNIGIASQAIDVDSMCKGGGEFTWDNTNYPGTSLNFGWLASRASNGWQNVAVSAGSITLTPSVTNYVELDLPTATVSSNTSGFTAGRLPLWLVTPGSATFTPANIVSVKPHLTVIPPGSVSGRMLTGPGSTKESELQLGASISATTVFLIPVPNSQGVVNAIALAVSTAITQSDTDYWSFGVVNLGAGGTGTTPVVVGTLLNTTKVTGGRALALGIALLLSVNSYPNNAYSANDVLQLTITKTGSPSALTLGAMRVDFVFTS